MPITTSLSMGRLWTQWSDVSPAIAASEAGQDLIGNGAGIARHVFERLVRAEDFHQRAKP